MNNYRQGEIAPTMLAYMAGIFDAEGCVSLCRHDWVTKGQGKSNHYSLRCSVSQMYGNLPDMFKLYFGGGIYRKQGATSYWYIGSNKAIRFLEVIEPYLIEKKEEAQIAIDYQLAKSNAKRERIGSVHWMSKSEIKLSIISHRVLKELKSKKLRQMPLMEIHPIEQTYAYLAGFFDGEGFIGIRTHKPKSAKGKVYHHLITTVTQSDKARVILELFRYYFGGAIHKNSNRAISSEWMAASQQSKKLLDTLLPYLRIKSEQAQLAIEFQRGIHIEKGTAKKITEQELAVREAQRIMLSNLKTNRLIAYKDIDKV